MEQTRTHRAWHLGAGLGLYLSWLLGALLILWLGLERLSAQTNLYDRDAFLIGVLGAVVLSALLAEFAAERLRHPLAGLMMRLTAFGYLLLVLFNSLT